MYIYMLSFAVRFRVILPFFS